MEKDKEQLKLLSVFHYVVGGLTCLFALMPIFHLIMGMVFVFVPMEGKSEDQLFGRMMGWFFVIFSMTFITVGWILGGFIITAGRFLANRTHYMFCLVIAGIECIFMPFGTVLGVFTIIVLYRESVKQMFKAGGNTG